MIIINFVGLIGFLGFLFTLSGLLYQIHRNRILKINQSEQTKALISRSQASYNYFYSIAIWCDKSRENEAGPKEIIKYINLITGIADAARTDIISYCRTHLNNFTPFREHPSTPGRITIVNSSTD